MILLEVALFNQCKKLEVKVIQEATDSKVFLKETWT